MKRRGGSTRRRCVPALAYRRTKTPKLPTPRTTNTFARHHFPDFATRPDVPDWLRDTALVLTLHGQHYTGYMFNDYAKMLDTLRWMNTQIPGKNVLVFISAWDGQPLHRTIRTTR